MALLTAITIGVVMAVSVYLLLSRELKSIAMGAFLMSQAANIGIIAVSRSPIGKRPPVLGQGGQLLGTEVDPLPQALILTAIVIGFALQTFLLTLLVITWRRCRSLELSVLAGPPAPVEGRTGSHDPQLLRFEMEENPLLDPEDDEYYARTHTLDTRH